MSKYSNIQVRVPSRSLFATDSVQVLLSGLVVTDNKLLLLSEKGELVVAEATAEAYRPLTHAQILTGRCWTTPVLSRGLLYARNAAGDVVCLDARTKLR